MRLILMVLMMLMNQCGIQGITLDWVKSYLTNRTQRCSVNGCLSDFQMCATGNDPWPSFVSNLYQ